MSQRPTVHIRPAQPADVKQLWEWRNDPVTRAASVNTDEVEWTDHQSWFVRTLAADDRHLLIGEYQGDAIGVIRFDAIEDPKAAWEVSITIAPHARGKGLSVPLLETGRNWLFQQLGPKSIVALIRGSNAASLRAFERARYIVLTQDSEYTTMYCSAANETT